MATLIIIDQKSSYCTLYQWYQLNFKFGSEKLLQAAACSIFRLFSTGPPELTLVDFLLIRTLTAQWVNKTSEL